MKLNTTLQTALMLAASILLGACASPERAQLESTRTDEAVTEVSKQKESLMKEQVDFFAPKEFRNGSETLEDAKEDISDNSEREEILEELAVAKAYFNKAKRKASNVPERPTNVVDARKSALEANLRDSTELSRKLYSLDEEVRDETDMFTKSLSAAQVSSFQKDYLNLETEAVQHTTLSRFRRIIENAEKNDAEDLAPKTLKQAQIDLKSAENMIAQSPRNSQFYKDAVLESNKSSKLLADVMDKLTGEAKGSSEAVALKLVYQERKVGTLSETVGSLKGDLASTKSNLDQASETIKSQKNQMLSAQAQVKFQQAMDDVRKNFDNNEAEVYQQGNKLILRLKDIKFASGSAQIPNSSIGLLGKIGDILQKIEPESIQIQGHTDSVGDNALNQKLSMRRAEAVEKFLESRDSEYDIQAVGFGEQKPLVTNETKEGRATNRRVDIVIDAK